MKHKFCVKNSKYNPNYSIETFVPKTTDAIFDWDQVLKNSQRIPTRRKH